MTYGQFPHSFSSPNNLFATLKISSSKSCPLRVLEVFQDLEEEETKMESKRRRIFSRQLSKLQALEARLLVNVITFRPITDRNCIGQTCEVKSSQAERGIPGRFIWHLLCLQQVPWRRSYQEFTCEIGEAQSETPRRLYSILSGGKPHSQP